MTSMSAFSPESHAPRPPDGLRAFAVCASDRAEDWRSRAEQLGVAMIDPMRTASAGFIARVNELQRTTLDAAGLAIPEWALYDCAETTGVVAGWSRDGAVGDPVSMMAATPTPFDGHWHVYGLCARDPSILDRTLALCVELIDPLSVSAVVGWTSPVLGLLADRWPLEILSAWTVSQPEPASATLRAAIGRDPPPLNGERFRVDPSDSASLRALHDRVNAGARLFLAPGSVRVGEAVEVLA